VSQAKVTLAQPRSSFYYSFSLLPRDERDAIQQVYAFCRYTDDLVDEDPVVIDSSFNHKAELAVERKRQRLRWWRNEVEKCYNGTATHPILKGLHNAILRFKIPKQYFLTLIDGVEMDLVQNRYDTFDELKDYCYAVASIVGLICIEIFGYRHEETKEYAVDLGIALQLTNIIRDVGADAEKGRIYIPREDLIRFNYTEQAILEQRHDENFVALMEFQAGRARQYYASARAKLRKDERFTLFAAEIMDAIYFRLLRKIELANYRVFDRKIKVSTPHKLLIVSRFWLHRFFL
jgi:15-cis-phytoene synthase